MAFIERHGIQRIYNDILARAARDAARAERAMHDHLMAQLQALKQLRAIEKRQGANDAG